MIEFVEHCGTTNTVFPSRSQVTLAKNNKYVYFYSTVSPLVSELQEHILVYTQRPKPVPIVFAAFRRTSKSCVPPCEASCTRTRIFERCLLRRKKMHGHDGQSHAHALNHIREAWSDHMIKTTPPSVCACDGHHSSVGRRALFLSSPPCLCSVSAQGLPCPPSVNFYASCDVDRLFQCAFRPCGLP